MNYKFSITLTVLIGLYGCQQETEQAAVTQQAAPEAVPADEIETTPAVVGLSSEIDKSGFDETVRPQDDFFSYVDGGWVNSTEIPVNKARWGTFDALDEQSQRDVRALVEEVSAAEDVQFGTPQQKIRDLYNSYMDAEAVNALGVGPIRADLDAIAAIKSMDDVYRTFSELGRYSDNCI